MKEVWYTTIEAAKILGISSNTVVNRIKSGEIKAKKVNTYTKIKYKIPACELHK